MQQQMQNYVEIEWFHGIADNYQEITNNYKKIVNLGAIYMDQDDGGARLAR